MTARTWDVGARWAGHAGARRNDIVTLLPPGANNSQSWPTPPTTSSSSPAGNLVAEVLQIRGDDRGARPGDDRVPGQRTFLGSGSVSSVNGILTVTIIRTGAVSMARRSWRQGR